jgi:hypothetical protein
MKKLVLLLFLAYPSWAGTAPKYQYSDSHLNDEFDNVYQKIDNVTKGTVRISSSSVRSLNVSTMTASSVTISNASIGTGVINNLTVQTINGSWPNPNILINGGMEIFQRWVSSVNPVNLAYTADRWQLERSGTQNLTITRDASVVDTGLYSMKIVQSGTSGNGWMDITQYVENYAEYQGKTVTVYCRLRSDTASYAQVSIADNTGSSASSYHSGGGAFETLTVSRALNSSATKLQVSFGRLSGSLSDATLYIDSIMLVVGSQSVAFIPRLFGQEVSLCQRYYEKSYALGTTPGTNTTTNLDVPVCTQVAAATSQCSRIYFRSAKYAAPTITFYTMAGVQGKFNCCNTVGTCADTTMSQDTPGTQSVGSYESTALESYCVGHWTAESEM